MKVKNIVASTINPRGFISNTKRRKAMKKTLREPWNRVNHLNFSRFFEVRIWMALSPRATKSRIRIICG